MIAHDPDDIPAVCAAIPFPSETHRTLAREVSLALAQDARVGAICLTDSIARGVFDPQSDLDMVVYTTPDHLAALTKEAQERAWASSEIWFDIEVSDADFQPGHQGWMNLDPYELAIGNWVAYARPLFERGDAFQRLRDRFLPYFDEALAVERAARFATVTLNHVDRARRGLSRSSHFDAAERLRMGVQTFLAGLFVTRRVYPVDYAKWVEQQVTDLLGLPELLPELCRLFDIGPLDPDRLRQRAEELVTLARRWLPVEGG